MKNENKDKAEKGDGFVIYFDTILDLPLKDLPRGNILAWGNVLTFVRVLDDEKLVIEKSIDMLSSWEDALISIPEMGIAINESLKQIADEEFGQRIMIDKNLMLRYTLVLNCKNLREALLLTDRADCTPETFPNTLAHHYDKEFNKKYQQ
jgi:hypothetical protein